MELTSADFPVHWPVQTRWADNDMFGHLNNAVYYQLFDTAINAWIAKGTSADAMAAPWLGVVAESSCRYFAELKFPADLVVGLAVTRLGTSSVTYRTALFAAGSESRLAAVPNSRLAAGSDSRLAAVGSWVHVYVDRDTRRPIQIPAEVRELLASAVV
ncbi:acyl-CoA thioesterase [Mycobacterium sp. BMJ-28]